MTQIECSRCGQPVLIAPGEEAYDLCWLCANQIVDKLRDLVAHEVHCEPDADHEECSTRYIEGACKVERLCAILSGADSVSAAEGE